MHEKRERTIKFGDADLTFETGRLATLANGAVLARWGDTVVLATVTMAKPREGIDFFPLTVEYIEKYYAAGMISSSRFVKRERFPSSDAILKARVIDRSIRPLFPNGFMNEIQVIVTVMSYDKVHDPALLGVNAVSTALMISDIPFEGPVAGIRVASVDDALIANPTIEQFRNSDMNLVISASKDSIIMIESGASEVGESKMIEAFKFAKSSADGILDLQTELRAEWGKEKSAFEVVSVDEEILKIILAKYEDQIKDAVYTKGREDREEKMDALHEAMYVEFEGEYSKGDMDRVVHHIIEDVVVKGVTREGRRPDGRGVDEIRPLSADTGILPRTHGTGLFQRGLTQALSIVTLASGKSEQLIEDLDGESTRRYFHHYNFKPFCVGEVGRFRLMPGRREIGHGALGERALLPVLPSRDEFPYTIRVVSEILSANGSTSMAATCGSTLALMDAGVPIKTPVAGIAMGLVYDDETKKIVVLTDIQGFEDHYGDMDFKVTGTRKGITALQMDNKLKGIPMEVLAEALEKAKVARFQILDVIESAIPAPREEMSKYAPRIESIKIDPEDIGTLIGPGGKMIREITETSGAEIEVEEDGTVNISSPDGKSIEAAKAKIKELFFVPDVGAVYEGTVARIQPYGAFVDIASNACGLVHVSELAEGFVKDPNDVVKEGDKLMVKVIGIDDKGRIKLSAKQAIAPKAK